MKIRAKVVSLVGSAALTLSLVACADGGVNGLGRFDGNFAGPPQGSTSSRSGLEPLVGASPFTFVPENKLITGFAVDHWYVAGGWDTNDGFNSNIPFADLLDALSDGRFEQFICGGNCGVYNQNGVWQEEANYTYPMVVSFMCQWFGRNADNSRPTTFDVFGRLVYSDAALDISFITAPITANYDPMTGVLISVVHSTIFPNGGTTTTFLPLGGWTTPPIGDPSTFPPKQQVYTSSQFSRLGLIRVRDVSAGLGGSTVGGSGAGSTGQGGGAQLSLGGAIADDQLNSQVETMVSIPAQDVLTGLPIAVRVPVGVFSDNYALSYRTSPVKQPPVADPTAVPPVPIPSIADPELEEAVIEFARHLAAVQTNIVCQAVGLTPGNAGSLMDPGMANIENRYEYRFAPSDVEQLATSRLPGRFR